MWTAPEIERARLETIAATWRLVVGSRPRLSIAAEHLQSGYHVFLPDAVRHARTVAAGVCILCTERPATRGQRCDPCALAANQKRRAEYEARKASGVCIRPGCGQPNDGTVWCWHHRALNRQKHRGRRRG